MLATDTGLPLYKGVPIDCWLSTFLLWWFIDKDESRSRPYHKSGIHLDSMVNIIVGIKRTLYASCLIIPNNEVPLGMIQNISIQDCWYGGGGGWGCGGVGCVCGGGGGMGCVCMCVFFFCVCVGGGGGVHPRLTPADPRLLTRCLANCQTLRKAVH